jgi:hypothetical protein
MLSNRRRAVDNHPVVYERCPRLSLKSHPPTHRFTRIWRFANRPSLRHTHATTPISKEKRRCDGVVTRERVVSLLPHKAVGVLS